jgi:deoxyribonuclease V
MACHLGLASGLPSVGCAERLIAGEAAALSGEQDRDQEKEQEMEQLQLRGARAPVLDGKEQVGAVLCTRAGTKPLYVSPGHLSDIDSAAELVLRCTGKYRRPEPLRRARITAKCGKTVESGKGYYYIFM